MATQEHESIWRIWRDIHKTAPNREGTRRIWWPFATAIRRHSFVRQPILRVYLFVLETCVCVCMRTTCCSWQLIYDVRRCCRLSECNCCTANEVLTWSAVRQTSQFHRYRLGNIIRKAETGVYFVVWKPISFSTKINFGCYGSEYIYVNWVLKL